MSWFRRLHFDFPVITKKRGSFRLECSMEVAEYQLLPTSETPQIKDPETSHSILFLSVFEKRNNTLIQIFGLSLLTESLVTRCSPTLFSHVACAPTDTMTKTYIQACRAYKDSGAKMFLNQGALSIDGRRLPKLS